jgi:dynein heavy chain 2
MGRIFTGLVKSGAWGCFDEFNRLDGLTLSAVSLQIQAIQMALKKGTPHALLMNEQVPIDPNSGIFVTLNPAGQGYGGRNKLPDNLKSQKLSSTLMASSLLQLLGKSWWRFLPCLISF